MNAAMQRRIDDLDKGKEVEPSMKFFGLIFALFLFLVFVIRVSLL